MHFLAHFNTHQQNIHPDFAFGLMVPDFIPGFTKLFNSTIAKSKEATPPQTAHFHAGLVQHFADDKIFHANEMFEIACKKLLQEMMHYSLNRNELRLSFLSHLLVEILLDRWLVEQQNNLPELFYAQLEQLNTKNIHLYFNSMELDMSSQQCLLRREWFLQNRFLFELHNTEQLVQGVGRLYARTTRKAITKTEEFRIIDSINSFYAQNHNWQALLIS